MGEDESNKIEDELLEIYCCATTRIGKGEESNSEEGEKTIQRGKRLTTMVRVWEKNWFEKVRVFIDHIRVVSVSMIWVLGT